MEIIDRYIYAVTQRLPEPQKKDIKLELQGLIEDMLEERASAGQASREDAESVLKELGHPNALVAKYRGYNDRYLIGPSMFEPYFTTLKIVLSSIGIALTVLFAIELIVKTSDVLERFTEYVVSLVNVGAQGFGWVTVIFAWIDYRRRKDTAGSVDSHKEWKPSDLPRIPDQHTRIKLSEPIAGIIFTVLFMVICFYSIDLLGIWRFQEGARTVIPFMNADVFQTYMPVVWGLAALGILKESIRIIARNRSGKLLAFHIVTSIVATVIMCVVLADPGIWNPDFIQEMEAAGLLSAGGEDYDTVVSIWTGVSEWLVGLIALFSAIDILSESYKWYRVKSSA